MKRFLSIIAAIGALLFHLPAFAQQAPVPADNNDHSLLWRISGKGLARPSYLFGTIHIICPDDYLWTDKMKECLAKSEKVCFEMDIADPNVMMEAAAGMMDKSGKKLKDYFTPEQYKLLRKYIKESLGLELTLFEQMKPVFVQTLMDVKKLVACENPVSYEETISKTAEAAHKQVLGLETPDEQMKAIETLSTDSVIKDINDQLVQGSGKSRAEYAKMLAAYKQQDLPELYNDITSSADVGEDMGPLLDNRNKKWIARMSSKMKGTSVFFAVGAGHLYGPNGVISLLRKNGYKVEPVQ